MLCLSSILAALTVALFVGHEMSFLMRLLMLLAIFSYTLVVLLAIADLIFPSAFKERGTK